MKMCRDQCGFGFFTFLYYAIIIAVVGYVAVLLVPVYLENRAVQESFASIPRMNLVNKDDSLAAKKTNIINYLAENFRMNNVVHVPIEEIKITEGNQGTDISISYTVQKHLIANIDLVLNFDNQVTVAT